MVLDPSLRVSLTIELEA